MRPAASRKTWRWIFPVIGTSLQDQDAVFVEVDHRGLPGGAPVEPGGVIRIVVRDAFPNGSVLLGRFHLQQAEQAEAWQIRTAGESRRVEMESLSGNRIDHQIAAGFEGNGILFAHGVPRAPSFLRLLRLFAAEAHLHFPLLRL